MKVAFEERVLALAGIVQAASLVNSLAKSGMLSQINLEASLQSIFITDPGDVTEAVSYTHLTLPTILLV